MERVYISYNVVAATVDSPKHVGFEHKQYVFYFVFFRLFPPCRGNDKQMGLFIQVD
jgi:hypothetical protein